MVSCRLKGLLLANNLGGDNVTIRVNFETHEHKDKIIFMSAYLPLEEKSPLSGKMTAFIKFSSEGNKKLVLGCDTNVHHTV